MWTYLEFVKRNRSLSMNTLPPTLLEPPGPKISVQGSDREWSGGEGLSVTNN